ncbi:hypothetical protein SAMN00808754_1635 [Thermanaeromonas toyohensis ToBE]|uniref:Uncharacterized protein n=1 Tax=Thermanaeromonas toyohensis ToBE TaxID=698762 RepID=A0A1W1VTR4_9FIRM|nr:hypothetical protein SAMN00808754_1635 [Thermanaeromonas toyohensis ToBE]
MCAVVGVPVDGPQKTDRPGGSDCERNNACGHKKEVQAAQVAVAEEAGDAGGAGQKEGGEPARVPAEGVGERAGGHEFHSPRRYRERTPGSTGSPLRGVR